jgi:anti-anti-sigma factor
MKIDVQVHGLVGVITPHGPLVGEDVERFQAAVTAASAQRGGRVVVDMRNVPFLDSAGIETLESLFGSGRVPTARPRLARLTDSCREALDLTEVLPRVEPFDTVENAIRSFTK